MPEPPKNLIPVGPQLIPVIPTSIVKAVQQMLEADYAIPTPDGPLSLSVDSVTDADLDAIADRVANIEDMDKRRKIIRRMVGTHHEVAKANAWLAGHFANVAGKLEKFYAAVKIKQPEN